MLTNKRGLITPAIAGALLPPCTPVEVSEDGLNVVPATGNAPVLGVTADAQAAQGEQVDVVLTDIAPVWYGADVIAGTRLKAADGALVPTASGDPQAVGIAMLTGPAGSIGAVLLGR